VIKAVFFDLYNTLVGFDPPREETQAKILKELGIEVTPESLLRPILAADDFIYQEHARYPLGKRSKEETVELYTEYHGIVLKEAGIEASWELVTGILKKWLKADYKMVLYDDVVPTLNQLKERGLILGLISNVDRDITSLYKGLGLADWLTVVVTSQEVGFNKPAPQIFRAALRKAKLRPIEALYVGDQQKIDVVGANSAGMLGVLIDRNGLFDDATNSPCISSLTQIVEYL
jgi:putative hydrolase of the HAD superfamily